MASFIGQLTGVIKKVVATCYLALRKLHRGYMKCQLLFYFDEECQIKLKKIIKKAIKMLQIFLFVLVGVFFGISLSLLIFKAITSKELKRTQRVAMFKIYLEVLMKKEDKSYQYSNDIRSIINAAHLSKMSKWKG